MTTFRLIAAAATACLAGLGAATAAGNGYVDDRSTPRAVIQSLYNAIGTHQYARAWSYFEEPPAADLDGPTDVTLWLVQRDERLGEAWYEACVRVEP